MKWKRARGSGNVEDRRTSKFDVFNLSARRIEDHYAKVEESRMKVEAQARRKEDYHAWGPTTNSQRRADRRASEVLKRKKY